MNATPLSWIFSVSPLVGRLILERHHAGHVPTRVALRELAHPEVRGRDAASGEPDGLRRVAMHGGRQVAAGRPGQSCASGVVRTVGGFESNSSTRK
jgi:hypothetical protein